MLVLLTLFRNNYFCVELLAVWRYVRRMDINHRDVLRRLLRQDLHAYRRDYHAMPGVAEAVLHWRMILRREARRDRARREDKPQHAA